LSFINYISLIISKKRYPVYIGIVKEILHNDLGPFTFFYWRKAVTKRDLLTGGSMPDRRYSKKSFFFQAPSHKMMQNVCGIHSCRSWNEDNFRLKGCFKAIIGQYIRQIALVVPIRLLVNQKIAHILHGFQSRTM
jgi:hypothetical protein